MEVRARVVAFGYVVEAVEVKLTLETRKLAVPEVLRQDLVGPRHGK